MQKKDIVFLEGQLFENRIEVSVRGRKCNPREIKEKLRTKMPAEVALSLTRNGIIKIRPTTEYPLEDIALDLGESCGEEDNLIVFFPQPLEIEGKMIAPPFI